MNYKDLNNKNLSFDVEKIPLDKLEDWIIDDDFNLKHKSNGFFSFIATNQDNYKNILISQNEIGLLAIFLKSNKEYFLNQEILIQKKQEPGNNPLTQLSPSIQMTYSNLIGRHGGKNNNLVLIEKYFQNSLYSFIRHEQSDSFLCKKNLNILSIKGSSNFDEFENFSNCYWINLDQLINLVLKGNIVHADTRSVLFFYFGRYLIDHYQLEFVNSIDSCFLKRLNFWNLKNQKNWSRINIKEITTYKNGSLFFKCEKDIFNKREINAYRIISNNREVKQWTQPLISISSKIYDLIFTNNNKQIFIIVTLNSNAGTLNCLEFLPTFSYYEADNKSSNIFSSKAVLINQSNQTEEGGRFWKRSNLHRIFYLEDISKYKDHENKILISLPQLLYFYEKSNYISMELRSISFVLFSYLIRNKWKFR